MIIILILSFASGFFFGYFFEKILKVHHHKWSKWSEMFKTEENYPIQKRFCKECGEIEIKDCW